MASSSATYYVFAGLTTDPAGGFAAWLAAFDGQREATAWAVAYTSAEPERWATIYYRADSGWVRADAAISPGLAPLAHDVRALP